MSTLYISEYSDIAHSPGVVAVGQEPATDQVVTFTGTAGASSAFQKNTTIVRIHTDGICSIKFGTAPTAVANTNKRLIAGQTEYFAVPYNSAYKVSAVTST